MGTIGKPLRRKEDRRLLTGRGVFIDDLNPPGTLHVAFVTSPYAHALIKAIDTSAARQMPGVIDVLTFDSLGEAARPLPVFAPPPEGGGASSRL